MPCPVSNKAAGEQVPNLMRADRVDPAATASRLNRLVTVSGRSGRPPRPVNMYPETIAASVFGLVSVRAWRVTGSRRRLRLPLCDLGGFSRTRLVGSSTTRCRRTVRVARSGSRSRHISPHSSPRRSPVVSSSRHSGYSRSPTTPPQRSAAGVLSRPPPQLHCDVSPSSDLNCSGASERRSNAQPRSGENSRRQSAHLKIATASGAAKNPSLSDESANPRSRIFAHALSALSASSTLLTSLTSDGRRLARSFPVRVTPSTTPVPRYPTAGQSWGAIGASEISALSTKPTAPAVVRKSTPYDWWPVTSRSTSEYRLACSAVIAVAFQESKALVRTD